MLEENLLKFGDNRQRWILQKFEDIKMGRKMTAITLNQIDLYCDYFEKYKNLIKW